MSANLPRDRPAVAQGVDRTLGLRARRPNASMARMRTVFAPHWAVHFEISARRARPHNNKTSNVARRNFVHHASNLSQIVSHGTRSRVNAPSDVELIRTLPPSASIVALPRGCIQSRSALHRVNAKRCKRHRARLSDVDHDISRKRRRRHDTAPARSAGCLRRTLGC